MAINVKENSPDMEYVLLGTAPSGLYKDKSGIYFVVMANENNSNKKIVAYVNEYGFSVNSHYEQYKGIRIHNATISFAKD